jgi:hypothetical protein
MSKQNILNKSKKRHFPFEMEELFDVFETNLDRIEFVKDHQGLENFVYISEINEEEYVDDLIYYACIETKNDVSTNYEEMEKQFSVLYDSNEMVEELTRFFQFGKNTLYIQIDFLETKPSQEDSFQAYHLLKEGIVQTKEEALSHFKHYPDWYDAKHANDILEEKNLLNDLEYAEKRLLHQLKKEIKEKIVQSVEHNNEKEFLYFTEKYKRIKRELE